jgi:NAD-dependent deacetylase
MPLRIGPNTHLLVLTGAGVSAESGVPTFRGGGGLWEDHPVEQVASLEGFRQDPALVWRFYAQRRSQLAEVRPNAGHHALADVERRLGDRYLLVTQNVDGLHRKAGSHRVVEIHGNILESKCDSCQRSPFPDETAWETVPRCDRCGQGRLRPAVVWFGEMLDRAGLSRIESFMRRAPSGDWVFLAVGTSGAVYPAAGLVLQARGAGAATWLVNLEPSDNHSAFESFVRGPSGQVLPGLFEWD